jgi:hypothetical protein
MVKVQVAEIAPMVEEAVVETEVMMESTVMIVEMEIMMESTVMVVEMESSVVVVVDIAIRIIQKKVRIFIHSSI